MTTCQILTLYDVSCFTQQQHRWSVLGLMPYYSFHAHICKNLLKPSDASKWLGTLNRYKAAVIRLGCADLCCFVQARVAPSCDQGVQTFMLGGPIAADLKHTIDDEDNSSFVDNGCWNLIAHYRKKLEEVADLEVVLIGEREEAAEEAEAMQCKFALLQQVSCLHHCHSTCLISWA